jgi:ATP-dependent DNA ligase
MIVRRDGPSVRLYSRNAYDWTARLAAIAAAAGEIRAKSFTIDGEAVVLGLTACHDSTSCAAGRPPTPQFPMPSI